MVKLFGGRRVPPQHTIRFWTDEGGHFKAEVEGVHGDQCEGLLDILEDIMVIEEVEATDDRDKPSPQGRAVRPRTHVRNGR
jgi:hypothetical protein